MNRVSEETRAVGADDPTAMPASRELSREAARILLVDDELALVRGEEKLLRAAGYEVVGCATAEEALEHLRLGAFDVVVTDIAMPGMDGLELLRRVREYERDVPVILRTGLPTVESAAEAVEYGALKYLVKPVPHTKLLGDIQRAVQLNRLAEAKRVALRELGTQIGDAGDRASLEASFERALSSLWIAFQPIIRSNGRDLFGYEALLRGDEPSLPHPGAILDAAERLGRLDHLGRAIRERAIAALSDDDDWTLFLNLHPKDLADPQLVSGLEARPSVLHRIVLELTERASLESVPDARRRIAELRALGCRIAIDDLGAGYAGLSSFVQLEPDIVKLDMSLVRDADKSAVKRRLIRSLTGVCQEMGFLVVGEGVETAEERDVLVELGCDLLQGYRFGRPGRPFVTPVW